MAKSRIVQEREKCIGCGACVALCLANWEMAKDSKSRPKKTELNEIGCNKEAADNCPVSCIRII